MKTVKQLVKELQEYDDNLEVRIEDFKLSLIVHPIKAIDTCNLHPSNKLVIVLTVEKS